VSLIWCSYAELESLIVHHEAIIIHREVYQCALRMDSYTLSMASAEHHYYSIARWPAVT
jgi:hypothetical protein